MSFNLFASVEHKDEFIDIYLSNISENLEEKTEIIEHILKNPDGTFIDIGTGGDAIAILAKMIPQTSRPTLIAADIDPLVIESIKKRREEINQYINSKQGPKVELVTMSAVNMNVIKDSTIAGISASALAHEVFSYVPIQGPLDQFIHEVCRVLEKDGVFVYRDPKWVDDPQIHCTMIVKKDIAKYYISLFLTKFLDREFSMLRDYKDECSKPNIYSQDQVKINIYLKNIKQSKHLSFQEFLSTPSHLIDYTKNFSIEAPKGLIAEIQRHYLMFTKNYFAPGFIDERFFKEDLNMAILSKEERDLLKGFAIRKSLPLKNDVIKKEDFPLYFKEGDKLKALFSAHLRISLEHKKDLLTYIKGLSFDKIDRNLFFLEDDHTLLIDPKMLVLLFHGKGEGLFKFFNGDSEIAWDLLEHLKLEGEEHYFYKTKDELITYFGQFSRFILKDTHKKNYILAPTGVAGIKEIERDFYKSILQRDMVVFNAHGDLQEPVTEKNIIHFCLQPEKKAFDVYKSVLAAQGEDYPNLSKWLDHVK